MLTTPNPPSHSDPPPGTAGDLRIVVREPDGIREANDFDALKQALGDERCWVWVDATLPSAEVINEIGTILGLHPLVAEDILERNQRPKIEVTDDLVHIVLFSVQYADEALLTSEVDFVIGRRFMLSVHEPAWDPRAIHQLRGGLDLVTSRGPDHLLWALTDGIVDGYFPCLDRIGDDIDALEDDVITSASRPALQRLFSLKRDLILMRRHVSPVREVFNQLTNRELGMIDADEVIYFRDVYDHLIRITDELDTHRELLSGTLEVYLTTVNNNLSLIMKRLTGVTVILAGIGAVAGIFGMSEAAIEAGNFWIVTGGIVASAGLAAVVLRKIGWI